MQPAPVEAGDIEVHLGATWIPGDVVKDFMVELLEPSWNAAAVMEVIYVSYTGQWNITNKAKGAAANVKANETYGTERINGFHILEASLTMRTVKVYDTKYAALSCREIRVPNHNETILAQQTQDEITPKEEQENTVDVKEIVFGHIGDSYEWHITTWGNTHITITLPVIVYSSTSGWHTFLSSRLEENGGTYEGLSIAPAGDVYKRQDMKFVATVRCFR